MSSSLQEWGSFQWQTVYHRLRYFMGRFVPAAKQKEISLKMFVELEEKELRRALELEYIGTYFLN